MLQQFGKSELKLVERARTKAEALIGDFYVLAPREWERTHYEVRTLAHLSPEEICDRAFAQVLCYDSVKRIGSEVIDRRDIYRICLQDHSILRVVEYKGQSIESDSRTLESLLLYVLTHELVHVVRFSQQMQSLNLPPEFRPEEEMSVEKTTREILYPVADHALRRVIATFAITK
jgi:hypothetical protein